MTPLNGEGTAGPSGLQKAAALVCFWLALAGAGWLWLALIELGDKTCQVVDRQNM